MTETGLNPEQLEAVEYRGGHLLVLAGAGSGKTRVLTRRISSLIDSGTKPWRILAMTFTNKAASEMSGRVASLSGEAARRTRMGTFHSVCAWILRREAAAGGWPENFSIYDSDDQRTLIRNILRRMGLADGITPAASQAAISRWKNDMVDPEEAASCASPGGRDHAAVYAEYDRSLRANGAFDFDDLLTRVHGLLRHDPDARGRYGSMFDHVLVDEYQDTNLVQRELLKLLAGPGCQVCAVGDDDQSIYGWRGARVSNILEFPRDFPGTRIIRLERNYRSTGPILAAASALVSHNAGRHGKTLWTDRAGGPEVAARELASPEEEAEWILGEIGRGSAAGGDAAVLYRTNAQSRLFESAALAAGIPYQVVGSLRFYEREEIKDLVAWARVLVNPGDRLSLDRVLNKPPRGIGDRSRELLAGWMDSSGLPAAEAMRRAERVPGIPRAARESMARLGAFLERSSALAAGGAPALEVIDAVLAGSGMLDAIDGSTTEGAQRLENLEEFRRSALEFDGRAPGEGLAGFLSSISLLTSADDYDPTSGRLYLMTLHCAKGLEFDVVFVAGVEEGLLPFTRPGRFAPDDLEEERRLLYVGMTRAREALHLTWAARRSRPGSPFCGPSRFISEALSGRACQAGRGVAAEPEQAAVQEFRKGMTIHHPRYGGGRVVAAVRRGSEWQLTVDFGMDEPKVLLTGYVPITVTGEARSRR